MSARCLACGKTPDECECGGVCEAGPLFATPAPPHNKQETSKDAARSMKPATGALRKKVLQFIIERTQEGFGGATNEEIEVGLEMAGNTVRPRVWELRGNNGHERCIKQSGSRRKTLSGRAAIVWTCA